VRTERHRVLPGLSEVAMACVMESKDFVVFSSVRQYRKMSTSD